MRRIYAYYALIALVNGIYSSSWLSALSRMGFDLPDAARAYVWFMLGHAALELPTGYIADRFGRRRIALLGNLLYVGGMGAVAMADTIQQVYVALCVSGLGSTMMSGAMVAWFIDGAGVRDSMKKFFLSLDVIRRINLGAGALVGAFLLSFDATFLWPIVLAVGLAAFAVGLTIESDKTSRSHSSRAPHSYGKGIVESLKQPLLLGLLGMGLCYGIEIGNRETIMQPYVVDVLGHGNAYGMVVIQAGVALFGIVGNRLFARFHSSPENVVSGRDVLFLVLPLVIMGLAQFAATFVTSVSAFAGWYLVAMIGIGWFYPLQSYALNSLISADCRALILSLASMLESIPQVLACVFVSERFLATQRIADSWNVGVVGMLCAIIVLLVFAVLSQNRTKFRIHG